MLAGIQNVITYSTRPIAYCLKKYPLSRMDTIMLGSFAGFASVGFATVLDKRHFVWVLVGGGVAFACLKAVQKIREDRLTAAKVIERLCAENTRLAQLYTHAKGTFGKDKARLEQRISQLEKEQALQKRKKAFAKEARKWRVSENIRIWKTACAETEKRTEEREKAKVEHRQKEAEEREAIKAKYAASRALKVQKKSDHDAQLDAEFRQMIEVETAAKEKCILEKREKRAKARAAKQELIANRKNDLKATELLEVKRTRKERVISTAKQMVTAQTARLKHMQQLRQSILDSYYNEIGSRATQSQSLPFGKMKVEEKLDKLELEWEKSDKRIQSLLKELDSFIPELGGAEVKAELEQAQREKQEVFVKTSQAFSHLTQFLDARLQIHRQTKSTLVCQKIFLQQLKGAQAKLDELDKTQKEVVACHKASPVTEKQAHMTRLVKIGEEMALCRQVLSQLPRLQAKSEKTAQDLAKQAAELEVEIQNAKSAYLLSTSFTR